MLAWTQRALALRDAQLAVLSQAATTRYALESMAGRLVDTGIATAQAAAHARELAQQVADMNGALARLGTGKLSADDFWEIHAETLKRFEELARDREAKRAATLAHIEALSRGHEASHGENVKRIEELARRGEASHAENAGRIEALAHGQQAARDESARRFSDLATAHEKILAAIDAAGAAHRQVEARVREIGEDLARKLGVDEFWAAQAEALSRAGKIAERLDRESQSLAAAIDAAKAELGDRFGVVERSAIRLLEEFRQGLDRAAADLEQLRGNEADRAAILSRLDREQRDSEARLAELQRLGSLTSENLTRLTAFVDEGTDLTHSIPDEFYFEFENRFRGTTEDIKHRVAIYAPVVKKAGAGTAKHPVADIGCGRGEWLDVLREKGLHALGIDINQTMVDLCVANGLGVVQADAVEYLRTRPQASLGAVTGIHIIEHLTFGRVLALLDACLAALKPGGVAIFETPNPENVLVGSCDFWYDPTHRAPLPPDMMRWVALSRGFARAEIMRLHPVGPEGQLRDGNEAVRTMLNERFNGPRDYAVVAYAPRARRK
jgi:SAM-dependent methyltransferase